MRKGLYCFYSISRAMVSLEKVAVVGMGYVGIPLATVLAHRGYEVLGVDRNAERVESINDGDWPLKGVEPELPDMLKKAVGDGRLTASTSFDGCADAGTIFVCVDTPIDADREPCVEHLETAARQIGECISKGTLVIVESTVAPGTMVGVIAPAIEGASGMEIGRDIKLAHCPERVMPGRLLCNLTQYDRVVGSLDDESADRAFAIYSRITEGELHRTDLTTAEIVKTAENAYRDVQIAFANEVALICEKLGADAFEVRRLVNTCPFRDMHVPGAGVGGHCLPKDPWLLAHGGREARPILIPAARGINDGMPSHVAELVFEVLEELEVNLAESVVAVLGASFLENSGDARNSPTEALMEHLGEIGDLRVHDPYLEDIGGAKVEKRVKEVLKGADIAVFMVAHSEYSALAPTLLADLMRRRAVVDGRNIFSSEEMHRAGFVYRGVGKGVIREARSDHH